MTGDELGDCGTVNRRICPSLGIFGNTSEFKIGGNNIQNKRSSSMEMGPSRDAARCAATQEFPKIL
jgi:hypothetical protein